jgi:hypothetical protein
MQKWVTFTCYTLVPLIYGASCITFRYLACIICKISYGTLKNGHKPTNKQKVIQQRDMKLKISVSKVPCQKFDGQISFSGSSGKTSPLRLGRFKSIRILANCICSAFHGSLMTKAQTRTLVSVWCRACECVEHQILSHYRLSCRIS